mmetsp:Transcript_48954/g.91678  ORF Transcript_48954/g.91678 Transcript_48954/m.91678 type:complete len:95 (+) Transcript_48954:3-287(+)
MLCEALLLHVTMRYVAPGFTYKLVAKRTHRSKELAADGLRSHAALPLPAAHPAFTLVEVKVLLQVLVDSNQKAGSSKTCVLRRTYMAGSPANQP